ncbi:MAG: hypothetical protein JWR80_4848 [Bradyrhizobium sp.]|nr:hypothetical protein [Bradyrhizobium sp.]
MGRKLRVIEAEIRATILIGINGIVARPIHSLVDLATAGASALTQY